MVWEAIFLLLILKIPVVYLGCVVWWAIRAEPTPPPPLEGAPITTPPAPDPRPAWLFMRRALHPRRPNRPHGSPQRTPPRTSPAFARAEADE